MNKRFQVHLISKVSDIDVVISNFPARTPREAWDGGPTFMARPDIWLTTMVIDESENGVQYEARPA